VQILTREISRKVSTLSGNIEILHEKEEGRDIKRKCKDVKV